MGGEGWGNLIRAKSKNFLKFYDENILVLVLWPEPDDH